MRLTNFIKKELASIAVRAGLDSVRYVENVSEGVRLSRLSATDTTTPASYLSEKIRRKQKSGALAGECYILPGLNAPIPPYTPPNKLGTNGVRQRQRLFDAQSGRCAFCDAQFGDDNPPTIDHILPRSKGGRNTDKNRVLVCWPCNARKGNMTSLVEIRQRVDEILAFAEELHRRGYLK